MATQIPQLGKTGKYGDLKKRLLFLLGALVGDLSKILLPRPRPFPTIPVTLRVPNETDSSYPSGHALIVSIGARHSALPASDEGFLPGY